MKKNKLKIIIFFIIFALGVGVGVFAEKKILENKYDLANNATHQVLEEIKAVGTDKSEEEQKQALQDAYAEVEKLTQKELDLQVEIMRLENGISDPIIEEEADSNDIVEEEKPPKEVIESEEDIKNEAQIEENSNIEEN